MIDAKINCLYRFGTETFRLPESVVSGGRIVNPSAGKGLAVVRNYLICEADCPTEGGWLGEEPDHTHTPGRELAEFLRAVLRDCTTRLTEVWNEEGWGWSFNGDWDGVTLNVVVQRIDHWLIICRVVSLLPRFLRSGRYEAALGAICYHLDRAVRSDGRFRDVQWFTAEEYDQSERGSFPG